MLYLTIFIKYLRNLQAYASSLSQFIYNICGYFLSPLFSASIMDSFHNKVEGMKWGFRVNEFMTVFGVIFVIIMLCLVKTNTQHKKPMKMLEKPRSDTDIEVNF